MNSLWHATSCTDSLTIFCCLIEDTMMLPTHALAGMVLALPLIAVAPEFAAVALVAGLFGGVFPDLDMYTGHRKTLHYPVYYSVLAAIAITVALFVPTTGSVAAAFFLLGAAVHSVSDVFGGGLELRPWEGTSDRAVYDHYHGRWIAPRRWVRYDGSPEDLLLSMTLALPLLVALDGILQAIVIAALVVGAVYAAVRRVLPVLAVVLVELVPKPILAYVPRRYTAGRSGDLGDR